MLKNKHFIFLVIYLNLVFLQSCTKEKKTQHIVTPDAEQVTNIKGILDTTFNNGKGYYISPPFHKKKSFLKSIFSSNNYSQISVTGKLTDDNKILILGNTFLNKTKQYQIYLAQHNIDGSLDTEDFGQGSGYVIQDHFPNSSQEKVFDFVQVKNGQILIPGVSQNKAISGDEFNTIFLTKFNSNGDLDLNFGNKGVVFNSIYQYGFVPSMITSAAMSDASHIVFAGSAEVHHGLDSSKSKLWSERILMGKFDVEGNIDLHFGNKKGVLLADQLQGTDNDFAAHDYINVVKVQNDGKILIGGASEPSLDKRPNYTALGITTCCYRFILARYNQNGRIDTSFGINGYAMMDFIDKDGTSFVDIQSILIQDDHKILVAGYFSGNGVESEEGSWQFGLARFNMDGSIDKTFGNSGYIYENFIERSEYIEKIDSFLFEKNKNIIAAVSSGSSQYYEHVLFKYTADGKPDFSFPDLPKSQDINFVSKRYLKLPKEIAGPSSNFNSRISIILQKNGKLLIFGITTDPSADDTSLENSRYFIARYK